MSWPSGEKGAVTIRSEKPLLPIDGDVVDPEAAAALGDEHIFAAILQAADRGRGVPWTMLANCSSARVSPREIAVEGPAAGPVDQLAAVAVDVQPVVIGIGEAVQIGADHRLRLVPFGDPHRLEAALEADPGVQADEVHEVGARAAAAAP